MPLLDLVKALHVAANVFWIGSIVAVGVILSAQKGTPVDRGALAHLVYRRVAAPAFGIAFIAGGVRLFSATGYYLVATHFMHPKLTLALVVIVIHHVLGGRARRLASGQRTDAGPVGTLTAVLALCAVGAAFLAELKPF